MSLSHPMMPWIWLFYSLVFVTAVVWTAVLLFKQRTVAAWCALIGAMIVALGSLTGAVISWIGPLFGLNASYNPLEGEPVHFMIAELAWRLSTAGMVCFQGALWFIFRKKDAPSERIAELEAAINRIQEP